MIVTTLTLIGCSESKTKIKQEETIVKNKIHTSTNRWYSESMAKNGKQIYEKNCVTCHGQKGELKPNTSSKINKMSIEDLEDILSNFIEDSLVNHILEEDKKITYWVEFLEDIKESKELKEL